MDDRNKTLSRRVTGAVDSYLKRVRKFVRSHISQYRKVPASKLVAKVTSELYSVRSKDGTFTREQWQRWFQAERKRQRQIKAMRRSGYHPVIEVPNLSRVMVS